MSFVPPRAFRERAARVASVTVLMLACAEALALEPPSPGPQQSAVAAIPGLLDSATRKEVAEKFAAQLDEEYALPELGKKMAQVIRAKLAAGDYNKIASGTEFAHRLETDARLVSSDKHLRVNFVGGGTAMPAGPPPANMMELMRADNGSVRKVQILSGNVGYMEVNGVPPLGMAKDAIAAAFAFLHNTDALIIDVRGNGGGDPNTVALYMSYLSEGPPYVVDTVHFRRGGVVESKTTDVGELSYGAKKPVFCLTTHRTFSGGEELAYDIQAFKRGRVVGEATGGGAHPVFPRPLGHGFMVGMPTGYGVHPVTGSNWEGVGVKPDIEVPAGQALIEAHRLAVDRLKDSASDPTVRAALETLLAAFQREAGHAGASVIPNTLTPEQVAGAYASSSGPGPVILQKDSSLFLQFPRAAPPMRLVPLGADRYAMEGFPDDFMATFTQKVGKVQLLAELGNWPPVVVQRQGARDE